MDPLHGKKTHPLSDKALEALRSIGRAPQPRQDVNPGVVNRLLREALVEEVQLPSPYKTVRGSVAHLQITAAGKRAIGAR